MLKRLLSGILSGLKGCATASVGVMVFGIVAIVVLGVFVYGVDALDVGFGETVTIMGFWAMFGALVGQNKPAGEPSLKYLNRKPLSVYVPVFMFCLIGLLYVIQRVKGDSDTGTWEVVGLVMLGAIGLVLGFIAGADKDPAPKDGGFPED